MRGRRILVAAVSAMALAVPAAVAGTMAVAGSATATPYCGITWGSLPKTASGMTTAPVTNVRAGKQTCADRLVIDLRGPVKGYNVRYVSQIIADGSGAVIPVRGGAKLQIAVNAPAYDINTGALTYNPANPNELVNVTGWTTFRQVVWAGTFEGYTSLGLGVRAQLPFQVFTLAGPGSGSRLVIDVANRW